MPGLSAQSVWNQKSLAIKYPPLKEDISVDVVVIGAGIAGLSCAYNLAKAGGQRRPCPQPCALLRMSFVCLGKCRRAAWQRHMLVTRKPSQLEPQQHSSTAHAELLPHCFPSQARKWWSWKLEPEALGRRDAPLVSCRTSSLPVKAGLRRRPAACAHSATWTCCLSTLHPRRSLRPLPAAHIMTWLDDCEWVPCVLKCDAVNVECCTSNNSLLFACHMRATLT